MILRFGARGEVLDHGDRQRREHRQAAKQRVRTLRDGGTGFEPAEPPTQEDGQRGKREPGHHESDLEAQQGYEGRGDQTAQGSTNHEDRLLHPEHPGEDVVGC